MRDIEPRRGVMPARVLQQRVQKRPRGGVECEVMREESRRLVGIAGALAARAQMRDDAPDRRLCADELAVALTSARSA